MTNEDIIKQYTDNWEYPETYHKDDILKMLDQARKDERNKVLKSDEVDVALADIASEVVEKIEYAVKNPSEIRIDTPYARRLYDEWYGYLRDKFYTIEFKQPKNKA